MTAAVITLHSVCNYGTQLQAYATQEKLMQYFNNVVFIDYRRPDTYGNGLLQSYTKGNPLLAPIIIPTLIRWKKLFGSFQSKNIHLTKEIYTQDSDFDRFRDCYDIYFVGSDQVWNTGWNRGVIAPLYLSFVPDYKPKFSYAASFGKCEFSEEDIKASQKYVHRFTAISVREESGKDIIEKQYRYNNVTRIVDPTLAMPPSFWRSLEPKSKIKGDYILIYNLNRSSEFDKYAVELSKRTQLPIYRICTRYDQIVRSGKSIILPDVLEFITLIDSAKYVLTDSFHATAFSMNLNTTPLCIFPPKYTGRISEFLTMCKSLQCHVKDNDDFDVVNRNVDFESVNALLKIERENVDRFLSNIVSSVQRSV